MFFIHSIVPLFKKKLTVNRRERQRERERSKYYSGAWSMAMAAIESMTVAPELGKE